MRLHRFFVKDKIENKTEIEISEERVVHQVRNVFRMGGGDRVIIFDGEGIDCESEIVDENKKTLKLKILESKKVFTPEKNITLFMSVIKKENFELVCEKACELGATKIVPVVTERTLMKNLNRERIEKILIESSEQCGRGNIPEFGDERKLEEILNEENLLVCDMGGESLKNFLLNTNHLSLSLLIGPEGGWAEDERKKFKEKNLKIVSLGKTVLRAETAGIVATAFLAD